MKTITLDNSTYNDISLYAKLNDISIADALKICVRTLLANFKIKEMAATDGRYYISPQVKALETDFRYSERLSSDYKTELSDALAEKYL